MNKKYMIIVFLIGISLLSACTTPAVVTPEVVIATQDPAQLTAVYDGLKAQALQTVQAEQTQEALANPTAEPTQEPVVVEEPTAEPIAEATATPLPAVVQPTLAPTNTPVVVVTTTATATNTEYSCSLVSSAPAFNQTYGPGIDFDAKWEIKNTGTETWGSTDIDFKYISGTKMHSGADAIDLSKSVANGDTITFTLDMFAPLDSGVHQEAWALQYGNLTFCVVTVTIQVD